MSGKVALKVRADGSAVTEYTTLFLQYYLFSFFFFIAARILLTVSVFVTSGYSS